MQPMDSQIAMSKIDIAWLTSPIGLSITSKAADFPDSFSAVTKLRQLHPEVKPELIGQAISQANLKLKADKSVPSNFLLTDDGLQQATRPAVAKFRAEYISNRFGQQQIFDLTCGLGFDAYFLAKAGHKVICIEKDPDVAAIASHNLKNLNIEVSNADANTVSIPENTQLVFVDPARRNPSGPRNLFGQAKRILGPLVGILLINWQINIALSQKLPLA
jgi:SAM-dependent methyltransferase